MTTALIVLALLAIAAGTVWYCRHDNANRSSPAVLASRAPARRFNGKGVVVSPGPPRPRSVVAARQAAPPGARFSGTARIPPNAIGLACGRSVAQCKRGRDCLCIP
jgi:hypothetical protein